MISLKYNLSILSAFLPSFLLSLFPFYLPSFFPLYLPSSLCTFFPSYLPYFLSTFLPSFLSTFLTSFLTSFLPSFLLCMALPDGWLKWIQKMWGNVLGQATRDFHSAPQTCWVIDEILQALKTPSHFHPQLQIFLFSCLASTKRSLFTPPEHSRALPGWECDMMDTPYMSHAGQLFAPTHKAERLLGRESHAAQEGRCNSWAAQLDR